MGFYHIPRRANLFAPAGYMCGCWRRFHYVPNTYDCGRPAKVYPGDNTYYCVKGAPLCAVDAEDAALLAIRRTVCRTMNQCYGAATPAQVAAVEAGIKYGWSDRRANPALYDADGAFCG